MMPIIMFRDVSFRDTSSRHSQPVTRQVFLSITCLWREGLVSSYGNMEWGGGWRGGCEYLSMFIHRKFKLYSVFGGKRIME
jgi:hypothetical protein